MKTDCCCAHCLYNTQKCRSDKSNRSELFSSVNSIAEKKELLTIMAFYTLTVILHALKSICMKCDVNHATY